MVPADVQSEIDFRRGWHPDPITSQLGYLAATFEDIQKTRISATLRGQEGLAESLHKIENQASRALKKSLGAHLLGDWLATLPGLGGPTTARLIAIIADPRKFPGQKCSEGHYFPAIFEPGAACPVAEGTTEREPGVGCSGTLLLPRRGTGTRSLWHYCGLHVVDGKLPMRRKGQVADWNPRARTLCLMPNGLADSIIKHRTEPYRSIYDAKREALIETRGTVEKDRESENGSGAPRAISEGNEADHGDESDAGLGLVEGAEVGGASDLPADPLRPFEIHNRARTVAVKAFLGDLLHEWKRLYGDGVEILGESEGVADPISIFHKERAHG